MSFPSEGPVIALLKKSANLRNFDDYKNIYINKERTPRELNYYKNMKDELNRRKSAEDNLVIRYINGIPTITSLN